MKPAAATSYRPQGGRTPHPRPDGLASAPNAGSSGTAPTALDRPPPPAAARTDADGAPMRLVPARSLLGAGLPARLALVAGALALLWLTVSWALHG